LDFAKAIQEKKGFSKLGKSSLKSVHSVVKKEKQTPIDKSTNMKATKSEKDVKKLAKKSHKNHPRKKLAVKTATTSKHLPVAKLRMVQKERCNECCPFISAVKRETKQLAKRGRKRDGASDRPTAHIMAMIKTTIVECAANMICSRAQTTNMSVR
jgi:hypothetical protein